MAIGTTTSGRRRRRLPGGWSWSRHGLLSGVRGLFMINWLFNGLTSAGALAFGGNQAPALRAFGVAAMLALAVWMVLGWRRHRFPAWAEPLEWLIYPLAAVAFGNADQPLGMFYGMVAFRPLYGSRSLAVVRTALAVAALVAMPLLVQAAGGSTNLTAYLVQIPTVLVLSGVTYLLGENLARQERAAAREQVLTQTGTLLTTTADKHTIYLCAADTALTLLGDRTVAHAGLAVPVDGGLQIVAAAGADTEGMVGARPNAAGVDPAVHEALTRGSSVLLDESPFDDDSKVVFKTREHCMLLPLCNKNGLIGVLAVASDKPVPREVRASLETLSSQVALGLESLSLTEELTRRAFYDSLTGLSNRALLHDRLDRAVARTRGRQNSVALLLLDMDGFKQINDSLGHEIGDDVLVGVAERLQVCVRTTDTVGRLGGDEFAILLDEPVDEFEATVVADRIVEELERPIVVAGQPITARMSIGIAIGGVPGDPDGAETLTSATLLRNADAAMYHAKGRRTGSWELYQPGMHAEALARSALEADLRRALDRGELAVHYQPIHALECRTVTGVEALLRWQHPTRGMISPAEFIPVAEKTGLIGPIGSWVLNEACRQVAAWRATLPPGRSFALSVNLSPAQLEQRGLADTVADTLRDSGLAPHLLTLELTEGVLVSNTTQVADTLSHLKDLGVRLAIDDFGTGFSSLGYLDRLPIDILKIDRSFIAKMDAGSAGAPLAEAIVRLGEVLRLETVAEGIETSGQLHALRALGCQFGQGYLFARPADAKTIGALLHAKGDGAQEASALPRTLAA